MPVSARQDPAFQNKNDLDAAPFKIKTPTIVAIISQDLLIPGRVALVASAKEDLIAPGSAGAGKLGLFTRGLLIRGRG